MKHNKQDLDAIIDDAARGIRDEQIDSTIINQSAARAWARISQQMSNENLASTGNLAAAESSLSNAALSENLNAMNTNNNTEQIHGCADFQSLIPAYLDKKLSTPRTLLLEDHSRECIGCRRALKTQRADAATNKTATVAAYQRPRVKVREQQRAYANICSKTNIER